MDTILADGVLERRRKDRNHKMELRRVLDKQKSSDTENEREGNGVASEDE